MGGYIQPDLCINWVLVTPLGSFGGDTIKQTAHKFPFIGESSIYYLSSLWFELKKTPDAVFCVYFLLFNLFAAVNKLVVFAEW